MVLRRTSCLYFDKAFGIGSGACGSKALGYGLLGKKQYESVFCSV